MMSVVWPGQVEYSSENLTWNLKMDGLEDEFPF